MRPTPGGCLLDSASGRSAFHIDRLAELWRLRCSTDDLMAVDHKKDVYVGRDCPQRQPPSLGWSSTTDNTWIDRSGISPDPSARLAVGGGGAWALGLSSQRCRRCHVALAGGPTGSR